MGMGFEDIRQIAVPPEDSALQDALVTLDRKISEYTAAVRDVASRLQTRSPAPQADPAPAPDETPVTPQLRKHVAGRLLERPADKPEKSIRQAEAMLDLDAPLAELGVSSAKASPAATPRPAPDKPSPIPAIEGSDEALLASLDEATVKAIRVLHRLNPQKSVQELLKHVQEHPPEHHARPAPKSWFRFGR